MAAFYGERALADTDLKRKSKTYYSALMVMVKWYEENGEYGKANEMADEILADVEKDTSQVALTMRSSALTRKAECEIHTGHIDEAERLYSESIDILMKGMTHPKGYWEIDPLFYNVLETSDFYLEHGKQERRDDSPDEGGAGVPPRMGRVQPQREGGLRGRDQRPAAVARGLPGLRRPAGEQP